MKFRFWLITVMFGSAMTFASSKSLSPSKFKVIVTPGDSSIVGNPSKAKVTVLGE